MPFVLDTFPPLGLPYGRSSQEAFDLCLFLETSVASFLPRSKQSGSVWLDAAQSLCLFLTQRWRAMVRKKTICILPSFVALTAENTVTGKVPATSTALAQMTRMIGRNPRNLPTDGGVGGTSTTVGDTDSTARPGQGARLSSSVPFQGAQWRLHRGQPTGGGGDPGRRFPSVFPQLAKGSLFRHKLRVTWFNALSNREEPHNA